MSQKRGVATHFISQGIIMTICAIPCVCDPFVISPWEEAPQTPNLFQSFAVRTIKSLDFH